MRDNKKMETLKKWKIFAKKLGFLQNENGRHTRLGADAAEGRARRMSEGLEHRLGLLALARSSTPDRDSKNSTQL